MRTFMFLVILTSQSSQCHILLCLHFVIVCYDFNSVAFISGLFLPFLFVSPAQLTISKVTNLKHHFFSPRLFFGGKHRTSNRCFDLSTIIYQHLQLRIRDIILLKKKTFIIDFYNNNFYVTRAIYQCRLLIRELEICHPIKGAFCSFGEDILIRRQRSLWTVFCNA